MKGSNLSVEARIQMRAKIEKRMRWLQKRWARLLKYKTKLICP